MDFLYISPEVKILFEDNEELRILKKQIYSHTKISEEQCKKRIIEIELSTAFYRHQDNQIIHLKKSFNMSHDGVINAIPKTYRIETVDNVMVLKIGNTEITPSMIGLAEKVGVVGYWDNANIIICVSEQYKLLFENIRRLFVCFQTRLKISKDFWGPNLKIM